MPRQGEAGEREWGKGQRSSASWGFRFVGPDDSDVSTTRSRQQAARRGALGLLGGPSAPRARASRAPPPREAASTPPAATQRLPTADDHRVDVNIRLFVVRLEQCGWGVFGGMRRSPGAGRDSNPHWFRSAHGAHELKTRDALPV